MRNFFFAASLNQKIRFFLILTKLQFWPCLWKNYLSDVRHHYLRHQTDSQLGKGTGRSRKLEKEQDLCANTIFISLGFELKINYRQFHKTLPRSSLQMHLISVRFYEMGDTCKTCNHGRIYWGERDWSVLTRKILSTLWTYHIPWTPPPPSRISEYAPVCT